MSVQRKGAGASMSLSWRKERVKTKDVAWCCDKLATMQGAGLPLYQAVSTLARMKEGTPLGRRLADVAERIGEGQSFASALRAHEDAFESLTCSLAETGEATGNIQAALARAAHIIDMRLRLRRKVVLAMIYPSAVAVITTVLIAVLLIYVVPKFSAIYDQAGADLPAPTRAVVALSGWMPAIVVLVVLAVTALVAATRLPATRDATRSTLARIRMSLPVVGPLLRRASEARVAATLANLLGAGVPLLDALELTAHSGDEGRLPEALLEVRAAVDEGSGFAAALERTGEFPEMMVSLAEVGEISGALAELMERYAETSEDEVLASAEALTSVVEPLMMLAVGLVVAVFLFTLYLPLLSLPDLIK